MANLTQVTEVIFGVNKERKQSENNLCQVTIDIFDETKFDT